MSFTCDRTGSWWMMSKNAPSRSTSCSSRERRREVEAEAVDVHLEHPVAEAVHDELQRPRVRHVQRVAAARVVHVVAAVDEPVVGGVVDAAEAQRRAEVVA